ncbi:class I SAM-dependent methyltransferase [Muriicola soli]|uniref:Class I SAM-dependent methyltransferase n=1 Tax=Muriicola soli TaxID=2507538 RepID=A0A411E8K1_9FLAO|nr:class I SAM-dependent methyltransferase [Muriicola soli]QBA63907.1 class I SAM-dependent methyltransferase [Muriicola soli]
MKKLRSIVIKILTVTVGNIMLVLFPKRAKELQIQGLSFFVDNNPTITDKLMRRALLKKAENAGAESLASIHKDFWINQGHEFCSKYEERLVNNDLPKSEFIFDLLQKKLANTQIKYDSLVEIGCGNGYILSYLSKKFPDIQRFIGVDLSLDQIKLNEIKYAGNKKLEFVAKDINDWIAINPQGNSIFVTFMGVLEYFTQNQLESLIQHLSTLNNIVFIAIEPIGLDHDFNSNPKSQIYGHEHSFSHNYPKQFQEASFTIWHLSFLSNNQFSRLCFLGAEN